MVQPNTIMNHISQMKKLGLKEVKDHDQSYSSELFVRLELSLKYALSLDSDRKILKNQKDLSHFGKCIMSDALPQKEICPINRMDDKPLPTGTIIKVTSRSKEMLLPANFLSLRRNCFSAKCVKEVKPTQ